MFFVIEKRYKGGLYGRLPLEGRLRVSGGEVAFPFLSTPYPSAEPTPSHVRPPIKKWKARRDGRPRPSAVGWCLHENEIAPNIGGYFYCLSCLFGWQKLLLAQPLQPQEQPILPFFLLIIILAIIPPTIRARTLTPIIVGIILKSPFRLSFCQISF